MPPSILPFFYQEIQRDPRYDTASLQYYKPLDQHIFLHGQIQLRTDHPQESSNPVYLIHYYQAIIMLFWTVS